MPKAAVVEIDEKKVRKIMKDKGLKIKPTSVFMGRSETYLSNVLSRGVMPVNAFKMFCNILGVHPFDIIPSKLEPAEQAETAAKKYHMEMDASPSKLHMELFFGSDSVCSAYSKIKGDSLLDLMQAISYAAHLMYKFAEQEELKKQE